MRKRFQFSKSQLQFWFFTTALIIYALWGSPTPDHPGLIEIFIFMFLMLAIGISNLFQSQQVSFFTNAEKWRLSLMVLWIYGLTIPLILSVVNEAPANAILRDLIGFVFLCLPLFMIGFIRKNDIVQKYIFFLGLVIGLVFSVRVLAPSIPVFNNSTELLYLANSPLVLMTALFLSAFAAKEIYSSISLRSMMIAILCAAGLLLTLAAMFNDVQRAAFAALAISGVIFFAIGLIKSPLRLMIPAAMVIVGLWLSYDIVMMVLHQIALKTTQVGSNMRLQEWQAVWETASGSWVSILFGQGWGSSFASPAVGGLQVTYTHSLLSYIFFKAGMIGLVLTLIYLIFTFEKLAGLYFSNPVKGNALLWPFLIPVVLYASHKSFDFGLLLVMILTLSLEPQKGTDAKI